MHKLKSFYTREKGELRMKKLIYFIAVIMLCAAPVSGAWAASFIYANSYDDTPAGQPPRHFITGETYKPPPKVSHPEYALGEPDIYAAGWGPETGKLVLGFESGLANPDGNADLAVWHFGTLAGNAVVKISTQDENPAVWTPLGILEEIAYPPNAGSGAGSVAQWFDFGAVTDPVYFVMIDKTEGGQSLRGHFIDAVGANAVPVPGSILLLGSGIIGMLGLRKKKRG
jgi:hypothetical protein